MSKLDKNNVEDIFPLSDIQQGMLFHSFKDDSVATYHDQNLFGLTDENFDFNRFRKALSLMIEKHHLLRTVFNLLDFDEPVQIVLKHIDPNVVFQSFEQFDSDVQYEKMKSILELDRKQSFTSNPNQVPWRMKLVQMSKDEICVMWLFHHAIFDGWSTSSFITELHNIYQILKDDKNFHPGVLKSTYKDYIVEQILNKESNELKDFWNTELSEYKRYALKNKIDEADTTGVEVITEELEVSLLHQIRKQSKEHGIPIKTFCLAAYLYALKLYSYERDILIGLMGNNRPLCEDSEKVLGCFLNAIPFRLEISATGTWLEFIQSVDDKRNILAGYDRLSFFEIVQIFKEDTSEQNPFFDVTFDFLDFHVYDHLDNYKGHNGKYLNELSFEKTNALLDFEVSITNDRFRYTITYATPLLSQEKVDNIALFYRGILHKLAYDVKSEIVNEELYSEDDRDNLLYNFGVGKKSILTNESVIIPFEEAVQNQPKKIAVEDSQMSLSYFDLNAFANRIAGSLIGLKVEREEIVLLYFDRGSMLLSSILGIMKSGASFVAIDTETPSDRIKYIIQNSNARVILTDDSLAQSLNKIIRKNFTPPEIVVVSKSYELSETILSHSAKNVNVEINGDDLAYVIYTSGTTGMPKGVMLHHLGLLNHLEAMVNLLKVDSTDVMAQTASCNFDVSIMQFLLCLQVGGKTAIFNKEIQLEPTKFLQKIQNDEVTLLELVPSHIETILDSVDEGAAYLSKTKFLLSTGEVLSERLVSKWYSKMPNVAIVNAYGPAETSDDVALHVVESNDINPIPVGKPLQNIHIYIIDQDNQLCPLGMVGEIAIAGVAVGKGYWEDQELTEKTFISSQIGNYYDSSQKFDKLFKTGDLGCWDEAGRLQVKGRIGTMVKIRGNRIELGEVESHLDKVPGVVMSIVEDMIVNDEKVLCAYYSTNSEISAKDIRLHLTETLPKYMLPSYYTIMEKFPTSQNGKIDRKNLPLPDVPEIEESETSEEISDLGLIILDVWKEVLSLQQINVNHNFFDVGGHSLNLIKVNTKLNKALDRSISIVSLFQYPTIRSLADHLAQDSTNDVISEDNLQESVALMDDAINFFSED
jgi:tyrocidine synthetase-3